MKRRRAVTLLEVVVAVAIVGVVAAIVAPVFGNARQSAKVSAATEQLRQVHRVIALYRADWETSAYGSWAAMGLPRPTSYPDPPFFWLPQSLRWSPCGILPYHRGHLEHSSHLLLWSYEEPWADYVTAKGESAALVVDEQCDDPAATPSNCFLTHLGLAARLDGSIWRRRAQGCVLTYEFWR